MHNTEDRKWWFERGKEQELRFVRICRDLFGWVADINPAKEHNPALPDLIVNGKLADLKYQSTPFFSAHTYGLEPRYCVTFNRKDYEYYLRRYPDIEIFVWVDWQETRFHDISIAHLGGIFHLPFAGVAALIETPAPEHHYLRRKDDQTGNGRSSFLLDIRQFTRIASLHNMEAHRNSKQGRGASK